MMTMMLEAGKEMAIEPQKRWHWLVLRSTRDVETDYRDDDQEMYVLFPIRLDAPQVVSSGQECVLMEMARPRLILLDITLLDV